MSLDKDIKELRKLFEEQPVFKAASPEQVTNRDKFSKPIIVPKEVRDAIDKVLAYMYDEEQKHFQEWAESDPPQEAPKDHIFRSLEVLADFIGWQQ